MNTILTLEKRIDSFALLGQFLQNPDGELKILIQHANQSNAWFTPESTAKAIFAIGNMLNRKDLEFWMKSEIDSFESESNNIEKNTSLQLTTHNSQLKIGLILAGNIPLVGFHDILCVLITGHIALIKLSSQDQKLIPFVLKKLVEIEPGFISQIQYIERLKDADAVIATGSTNTSRYFEYYFSYVPHIIRKNRNSVAILTGNETTEQLKALGHDIFDYFGLGCRNVSKLLVPKEYNFNLFFETIEEFKAILNHHKYNNNYDYNKSIFLVNLDKHLDNGFLLLKKDERFASPLAVLYYEEYSDLVFVKEKLNEKSDQIQCIVTEELFLQLNNTVSFGQTQHPKLWDYADGVNTMSFLKNLNN